MLELTHACAIITSMIMDFIEDEIHLENDEEIQQFDFMKSELKHGGKWKIEGIDEIVVRKALVNFKRQEYQELVELMQDI